MHEDIFLFFLIWVCTWKILWYHLRIEKFNFNCKGRGKCLFHPFLSNLDKSSTYNWHVFTAIVPCHPKLVNQMNYITCLYVLDGIFPSLDKREILCGFNSSSLGHYSQPVLKLGGIDFLPVYLYHEDILIIS